MGVTMVGNFLSAVFTRDELLVGRLASCTILGMAAPVSRSESVMSRRTSYRFVDSNTGGEREVVKWRVGHNLKS